MKNDLGKTGWGERPEPILISIHTVASRDSAQSTYEEDMAQSLISLPAKLTSLKHVRFLAIYDCRGCHKIVVLEKLDQRNQKHQKMSIFVTVSARLLSERWRAFSIIASGLVAKINDSPLLAPRCLWQTDQISFQQKLCWLSRVRLSWPRPRMSHRPPFAGHLRMS
jgi:hypothetical protein